MSETKYRPIDIDFEVYQLIVLEKRGFDESDNEALRRLLGLFPCGKGFPGRLPKPAHPSGSPPTETKEPVTGILESEPGHSDHRREDSASWFGKGVILPEGTKLRMSYGGVEHNGIVAGGKWEIKGMHYNTPSQAAFAVARTKHGGRTQLNGWKYWHVKRPSDADWVLLDRLRGRNRG